MKSLGEIKVEHQKRIDAIMKNSGMFFAFSEEQFLENKTPLEEGGKYVSIGAGGYMPKSKKVEFDKAWDEENKRFQTELKSNKGARVAHIKYELGNHEAWYVGDINDTMRALGSSYTEQEVWKVYQANKEEWCEINGY